MPQYKANILGDEVNINLNPCVISRPSAKTGKSPTHKVSIDRFTIDGQKIETILPYHEGHLPDGFYSPARAKRGDDLEPMRCFFVMEQDSTKSPAFFNIGLSQVQVTHNDKKYMPKESFGKNISLSKEELAKFVFGINLYTDLVYQCNDKAFTPKVIYSTNDEGMQEALIASGWTNLSAVRDVGSDESFLDALLKAPEPNGMDNRPCRFRELDDGKLQERSEWNAETEACAYEDKGVFVYDVGTAYEKCTILGADQPNENIPQ